MYFLPTQTGANLPKHAVQALLHSIDADESGSVQLHEFLAGVADQAKLMRDGVYFPCDFCALFCMRACACLHARVRVLHVRLQVHVLLKLHLHVLACACLCTCREY